MVSIGGHVSVAGGLKNGIAKAQQIGAHTIQIFGSSPRQWTTHLPKKENVDAYKEALKKSEVETVFLHAPYLVNLGTQSKEFLTKSIRNLIEQLLFAEMIQADGVIFHVGSFPEGIARKAVMNQASEAIKMIFKHAPGKTQLIMENAAGGDKKIGSSIDDLAYLFKKIKSPRIKICIDTAHAFEAGLIKSYIPSRIKNFFDEIDKKIGLKNMVVLHVNDSKTLFDSHHDRHENIGKGYIGLSGFKNLAREKRVKDKPWILEVPGFQQKGPDKKNIQILKSCFQL